jgi:hypothetical protein
VRIWISNIALIEAFGMARVVIKPLPDRGLVRRVQMTVLG